MGQRSQIYIRYDLNLVHGRSESPCKVKNYRGLIARYFQWNYGERMVSRARGIVETIRNCFRYKFQWGDEWAIKKLERVCDVNFDMRDITLSFDILEEIKDEWDGDMSHLFDQDNNDGQLLVDVTDDGLENIKVKYAFIPFFNDLSPMDGAAYMDWDCQHDITPDWTAPTEYRDQKTIDYTMDNIKYLRENAQLMTADEVREFIEHAHEALEPAPF